jgi:hypothetical protein
MSITNSRHDPDCVQHHLQNTRIRVRVIRHLQQDRKGCSYESWKEKTRPQRTLILFLLCHRSSQIKVQFKYEDLEVKSLNKSFFVLPKDTKDILVVCKL